MGRDAIKATENPCFRCRKEAAKHNDRLYSREGAAELLGVSVSSLAEYETGITKVIPVDKIALMADLYCTPELKLWYCTEECPIGRSANCLPSYELSSVEKAALKLMKMLRQDQVKGVTDAILDVTADGIINEEDHVDLLEIMKYLSDLIRTAGQLQLICLRIRSEGHDNG